MSLDTLSHSRKHLIENLSEKYREVFAEAPCRFSFSPGRINLIGEHTDYNGGFVFPTAIEQGIGWVFSEVDEPVVDILSVDMNERFTGALSDFESIDFWKDEKRRKSWLGYVAGVYVLFKKKYGFPTGKGFRAVFGGNLPMGGGLSSSAALETSFSGLLEVLSGRKIDCKERALLCQKAENEMVGVECGIMDQLASSCGRPGKAMFVDTLTLEVEHVDVPLGDNSLMVVNSAVKRELSSSEYNLRRSQCERAARLLGVRYLREVEDRERIKGVLSEEPVLRKRALHVFDENLRTLKALEIFREGKEDSLKMFGELMYSSHFSLRYYFEVSITQLDFIVDVARSSGALGARLVGAGFGGSALVLIPSTMVDGFKETLDYLYSEAFDLSPSFIEVKIDGGTIYGTL